MILLDWPEEGVSEPRVETPTARDAMLRVIAGTCVTRVTDAARLARQFRFAQALVERFPSGGSSSRTTSTACRKRPR